MFGHSWINRWRDAVLISFMLCQRGTKSDNILQAASLIVAERLSLVGCISIMGAYLVSLVSNRRLENFYVWVPLPIQPRGRRKGRQLAILKLVKEGYDCNSEIVTISNRLRIRKGWISAISLLGSRFHHYFITTLGSDTFSTGMGGVKLVSCPSAGGGSIE